MKLKEQSVYQWVDSYPTCTAFKYLCTFSDDGK